MLFSDPKNRGISGFHTLNPRINRGELKAADCRTDAQALLKTYRLRLETGAPDS